MAERLKGMVKWFSQEKGYGFITVDETGQDIFIHRNDLNGVAIGRGDSVAFSIGEANRGPVAQNVTRIMESTRAVG